MCSVFVWNEVDIQGVRWKIGLWELWTQMPSTTLRYPTSPSAESSVATLNDWSVFAIFLVQERGIVLALALFTLLWHKHKIWIRGDGAQWDRENEMRAQKRRWGIGPFPLTRLLETVTVAWWQVSQIYESPRLLQVCCPSRPEEESWWTLWTLAFRNLWASLGTLMISQQDGVCTAAWGLQASCIPDPKQMGSEFVCHSQLSEHLTNPQWMWAG